jgi:hypothetical protein
MLKKILSIFSVFALVATADASVKLQRGKPDGYKTVGKAQWLGSNGKLEEGRALIAELRARPKEGCTIEEIQSVDMAEFAFLRSNIKSEKKRCIECLKSVYDTNCTSFWGWAAYNFLKELGSDVKMPPKDPLCGLGKWGDGVVNLEPKRLEWEEGKGKRVEKRFASALEYPADFTVEDLKIGSPVRRAILRKRLVEICGEKKIKEILSAKGGEELFNRLWNDDAMLEDFLLSGPITDAPGALETLMTIFLNDGKEGWTKTDMGRKAAVATAINALKEDDMASTVRYWAAFRRIGMAGRFVPETAKRDCREWRFIVRRPVNPADILYLNAIVEFPKRYISNLSLTNVPYRKVNCFGDRKFKKVNNGSKKNAGFYAPWNDAPWPKPYMHSTVGGVCVEQAHWGARCANAHGIMAETARQPGRKATKFIKRAPPHQCWLFREENGNWRLVNSIRPYTGAEFFLWGKKSYQYLVSVERAFADREAHDESELLLFAGRVREAAMRCPYNWTAWRAYTDSLVRDGASIDDWRRYLDELLKLAPEGRLASWDFAYEAVCALQKAGLNEKGLAEEVGKVFGALVSPKTKISEEMDFYKYGLERFLGLFKKSDEIQERILATALKANGESASYFPQILDYAIQRFGKDNKRLTRLVSASVSSAEGSDSDGGIDWRRLFSSKRVLDDITAFRTLANLRNESDPPAGDMKVLEEDYGSPLVSGDALLRLSSSAKNDTFEDYPRVSDATACDSKRPGLFKTRKRDGSFAIVQLAGNVIVKGVTVLDAPDDLIVWVSRDGDEWVEVGKAGKGNCRVDLRANPQTVKFVKIGFAPDGLKRELSLKKILVYGDRLY